MWVKFKDKEPLLNFDIYIYDLDKKSIRGAYLGVDSGWDRFLYLYDCDIKSSYFDKYLWWDDVPPMPDESNTYDPDKPKITFGGTVSISSELPDKSFSSYDKNGALIIESKEDAEFKFPFVTYIYPDMDNPMPNYFGRSIVPSLDCENILERVAEYPRASLIPPIGVDGLPCAPGGTISARIPEGPSSASESYLNKCFNKAWASIGKENHIQQAIRGGSVGIPEGSPKVGEVWGCSKSRAIITSIDSVRKLISYKTNNVIIIADSLKNFLKNNSKCEDQSYWYEDDSFKVGRVYLCSLDSPRRILFINENVILSEHTECKLLYTIFMKNSDGIYASVNPRMYLTLKLSTNQELVR